MERRKTSVSKSSPLPQDYLKMVREVFGDHFKEGLDAYCKLRPNSRFEIDGAVYADEVVLAVCLASDQTLAATTWYASADFDPKASAPSVQDLLSACVDTLAGVVNEIISADKPEKLEQVADESLSALEDAPFQWTKYETDRRDIFVKVDKANLRVDQQADEWLAKNDPDFKKNSENESKATEDLFFTGPKTKKPQTN
ncbi:MAG: hypothetical protein HYX41_00900 [Bdellovibrio sp.]|nr:hypothetical protein [Bdellovibrio sp.]